MIHFSHAFLPVLFRRIKGFFLLLFGVVNFATIRLAYFPFFLVANLLETKLVNCLSFTVSWTGPGNLSMECTRFFMFFFTCLGAAPIGASARTVFFIFLSYKQVFSLHKRVLCLYTTD
jgi:hypothetical protein